MQKELVIIRRAEARDAAQLVHVHEASWRNAYQGILPHSELQRILQRRDQAFWGRAIARDSGIYVLEYEGNVVGYANVGPCSRRALVRTHGSGHYGEIFELYLHPVFQGLGFGGRLFETVRQRFRAERYRGFFVRALAENDGARQFYERRGGTLAFQDVDLFSGHPIETVSYFWSL